MLKNYAVRLVFSTLYRFGVLEPTQPKREFLCHGPCGPLPDGTLRLAEIGQGAGLAPLLTTFFLSRGPRQIEGSLV